MAKLIHLDLIVRFEDEDIDISEEAAEDRLREELDALADDIKYLKITITKEDDENTFSKEVPML